MVDAALQQCLDWVTSWVQLDPQQLLEAQDDPWVWERLEPSPLAQVLGQVASTRQALEALALAGEQHRRPQVHQRAMELLVPTLVRGAAQTLCATVLLDPATWAQTMGPWLRTHGDWVAPLVLWNLERDISGISELIAALEWYVCGKRSEGSRRARLVRRAIQAQQQTLWSLSATADQTPMQMLEYWGIAPGGPGGIAVPDPVLDDPVLTGWLHPQ